MKARELKNLIGVFNASILDKDYGDFKLSYKLSRIGKELTKEGKVVEEQILNIIKKNCIKDKEGNPVLKDKKYYQYKGDDESKTQKEVEKFLDDADVKFEGWNITMKELEVMKPKPREINILEPIIKG